MNIVKLGGSLVNPDGNYDENLINDLRELVEKSKEKFIFIVGGGGLCRKVQESSEGFLREALGEGIDRAEDWLGIATTLINAEYVLEKFKEELGSVVYSEVLLDPTQKIKSDCRVFFTGGWKPGCSTDKDMMLLAKNFGAKCVFKLSNFNYVKKISPLKLREAKDKKKILERARDIKEMSWQDLQNLVGKKWIPGLNTPFDPEAVKIGLGLNGLRLYIGKMGSFMNYFREGKFKGTMIGK